MLDARHGVAAPAGLTPPAGTGGGRFGRMFADVVRRDPGAAAIEALATAMGRAPGSRENPTIPAGYTYLCQFIDHDISFDAASQLGRANDPDALPDFRTPRFDLDSVYGSGPADQPYLYDWADRAHPGVKLLVGPDGDLPRNAQGRALIGDPRNDEHLIIAQLHLLVLRFHNQVVERLRATGGPHDDRDLLEEAVRVVRWHYQWIVRHDVLPRLVGGPVGTEPRRFFTPGDDVFLPVEFSAAAFRCGHSMVRASYALNDASDFVPILYVRGGDHEDLSGFRALPERHVIEWKRFFALAPTPPMLSMRIDPRLTGALLTLPPDGLSLARLNLRRGRALELPAGADVARAIGVEPIAPDALGLDIVDDPDARAALEGAVPLWYYILREAYVPGNAGQHLGPVGALIVREVLTGLLDADPRSYGQHRPAWRPELPRADEGDFTMADLVRFVEAGEAAGAGAPT